MGVPAHDQRDFDFAKKYDLEIIKVISNTDVDNEVLIDATKHFVRHGDFVRVKVYEASDYDLYAEPVL